MRWVVSSMQNEINPQLLAELTSAPEKPSALTEADLRTLAQIIYEMLKEELRLERERLGR